MDHAPDAESGCHDEPRKESCPECPDDVPFANQLDHGELEGQSAGNDGGQDAAVEVEQQTCDGQVERREDDESHQHCDRDAGPLHGVAPLELSQTEF